MTYAYLSVYLIKVQVYLRSHKNQNSYYSKLLLSGCSFYMISRNSQAWANLIFLSIRLWQIPLTSVCITNPWCIYIMLFLIQ